MQNKLKGKRIFIEDDLTYEQSTIRVETRHRVCEKNIKDAKEIIGFKKIIIDGESWAWT